jgi:predicted RNA methylase
LGPRFPDSLFDRLADWHVGVAEQSILDLGTGTGSLARGFAMRRNKVLKTEEIDKSMNKGFGIRLISAIE